jgi:transposase
MGMALREMGATKRGLGDYVYRVVAESYKAIVLEGEQHPVKALAEMHIVDISTASRWISEAKRRGLIDGK